jgi:hypothetical protein
MAISSVRDPSPVFREAPRYRHDHFDCLFVASLEQTPLLVDLELVVAGDRVASGVVAVPVGVHYVVFGTGSGLGNNLLAGELG